MKYFDSIMILIEFSLTKFTLEMTESYINQNDMHFVRFCVTQHWLNYLSKMVSSKRIRLQKPLRQFSIVERKKKHFCTHITHTLNSKTPSNMT